jgi:ribosomal-protein-alanine N-acetyltransferase
VGYLSAIRVFDELHLLQLAAHPKYRRIGVCTKLLNHALEKEQRLNHVLLEVRETNKAAIAFYKKMGFYKVGRRRRYYADTGEDALVLAKELE